MKRGALINLLIGVVIALLPLYNRVTFLDFNRTSKDNLLVILFGLLGVLMPNKTRELPKYSWFLLITGLFFLIINQHNVLSINVMFHTFYIVSGMFFLVRFYECYESESKEFILNGMCAGAIIQSLIIFSSALHLDLYNAFFKLINPDAIIVGQDFFPAGKSIGTLGYGNLAGSYLALTSLAFLRGKWTYYLPITVLALTFTNSAMGVGSFVVGALYYLNQEKHFSKLKIYLLATISMIGMFFIGAKGADSGRFEIWNDLFSRVNLKHFLIGMGPGWFPDAKLTWHETSIVQEHNEYLAFFNIFGLIGVILIIPLLVKFFKSQVQCRLFSAIMFVAFCNCYGHFALHQSTTAIIILVTIVICAVERKHS